MTGRTEITFSTGILWGVFPALVLLFGAALSFNESLILAVYPAFMALCFFVLMARWMISGRGSIKRPADQRQVVYSLLIFFATLTVSALLSGRLNSLVFVAAWISYCAVFVLVPLFVRTGRSVEKLFSINLWLSLALGAVIIVCAFLGMDSEGFKEVTAFNRNSVAVIIVAPFFIFLANIMAGEKMRPSILFIIFMAMIALVVNQSRGAWISYLAGMVVLLVLLDKKKLLRFVPFLAVIAVTVVVTMAFTDLGGLLYDRFFSIFNMELDDDSTDSNLTRLYLLLYSLSLLKQYWLWGVGPGGFLDAYALGDVSMIAAGSAKAQRFLSSSHTPHNIYLRIWIEGGIFSLVAFLAFIVMFMKWIRKRSMDFFGRWSPNHAGAFCSVVATFISGFFNEALFDWFFWYNAGLIMALCQLPLYSMKTGQFDTEKT